MKNKVDKCMDICFYLGLTLAISVGFLGRSYFAGYFSDWILPLFVVSWFLVAVEEVVLLFTGQYKKKDFLAAVVFFGLFLVLIKHRNATVEIATFLPLAYVAGKKDFEKVAKCIIIVESILFLVVIVAVLIGQLENSKELYYDIVGNQNEEARDMFFMGFLFHLMPGYFMLNITLLALYLNRKKISSWVCLGLLVANGLVYVFSYGRMSYGMALLAILLVWMVGAFKTFCSGKGGEGKQYGKGLAKWLSVLMLGTFPVSAIVSFLSAYYYNSEIEWMEKLNSALGGRFSLAQNGFEEYGISLFGSDKPMVGAGFDFEGNRVAGAYNWVDNAWMNALFRYGVIFMVALCILCTWLLYRLWKQGEYAAMYLVCVVAVWMLIDDNNILFCFNGFLVMLGSGMRTKDRPTPTI